MIKNDRQYRITRVQAERFREALSALMSGGHDSRLHPAVVKAQQDALTSQLEDLEYDLREYEAIRSSDMPADDLRMIREMPKVLIRARIASGMSQRQLADRLGLKEQQIQRYEATEYAGASVRRIKEVAHALQDANESPLSVDTLMRTLNKVGLDKDFVYERLAGRVQPDSKEDESNWVQSLLVTLRKVFEWFPDDILRGDLAVEPVRDARFKVARNVNIKRHSAYTVYAHYLALLVLQATNFRTLKLPTDPYETRELIVDRFGDLSFGSIVRFVWSLGIPVLPLSDRGSFQGACFRSGGRNVIVVKDKRVGASYWRFNLLHEYWHCTEAPEESNRSVLEEDEMSLGQANQDSEIIASQFAGAVLLGPEANALARECVRRAGRDLRRLKSAVVNVAKERGAPEDSLATYVAWLISLEGQNWWGAASNLQIGYENAKEVGRAILLEECDVRKLADTDRFLLERAIS